MAGGGAMKVKTNKFVEDWGTLRENLEFGFRFSRRNLAYIGIFGLAVPVLLYKGIVDEFHKQDELAGRPPTKFL